MNGGQVLGGLSKRFGQVGAVAGLGLTVRPGEVFGFVA